MLVRGVWEKQVVQTKRFSGESAEQRDEVAMVSRIDDDLKAATPRRCILRGVPRNQYVDPKIYLSQIETLPCLASTADDLRSRDSLTRGSNTGHPILQGLIDDAGHGDAVGLGISLNLTLGRSAALHETRVAKRYDLLRRGSVRVHAIFHEANFHSLRLSH
jgi:hypothetical protein